MSAAITIRAATAADFHELYGEAPKHTVWAEVAELDGRVVGIAGIAYGNELPLLFSRLRPELRPYKRFILNAARHLAARARKHHAVAIPDRGEPLSAKLLTTIGGHKVATSTEGDVYAWPTQ